MENKKQEQDGEKKISSNGVLNHFWQTLKDPRWLWVGLIVAVIVIILLLISEGQFPNVTLSNGIVAFISAVIGVLLTAFAISIQLKQQSDAETRNDKEMKMYQRRIRVYSEFSSKMWKMFSDMDLTSQEIIGKLDELRFLCFDQLVFFLSQDSIDELTAEFQRIRKNIGNFDSRALCKITDILKKSLEDEKIKDKNKKTDTEEYLQNLYNAFDEVDKKDNDIETKKDTQPDIDTNIGSNVDNSKHITFWHFNILYEEQQIKAFKQGNWALALIEYGEDWRTKLIEQVKPNDVIFLFKRGGAGYIGAFRALNPQFKILEAEKTYSDTEYAKYDIYNGIDDGATLASNILVEPIAYNFKGVGYYTVRRRTIERMNNMEAVKFLLNRFNGKDLDENQLIGKGKFDSETSVQLNDNYFSEIVKQNDL